jgi:hypothetical protein
LALPFSLDIRYLDQLVVIFVAPDPYPFDRFSNELANGPMMIADAN